MDQQSALETTLRAQQSLSMMLLRPILMILVRTFSGAQRKVLRASEARQVLLVSWAAMWPVTPNEDGQAGQDEEREGEVAFSSAPAVAYALGRCELVAAGSFCSIGRRLLGNDQNEAFGHEVLEYSGNDCPHVVLVKSAPPS